MSRRRRDNAPAIPGERAGVRPRRAGRRRRRLVLGMVRGAFWTLVLAGVFVLGIGYGRTLSGDDELRADEVTIEQDPVPIEATLPTRTVTVTRTVRVRVPARTAAGRARATVR